MTQPLRNRLPGLLLAGVLVSACGAPPPPEPEAPPTGQTVDPAELEAAIASEEAEADRPTASPDWQPQIETVPAEDIDAALERAVEAHEAGRLLRSETESAPAPEAGTEAVAADAAGALETYLGILATDPGHARANAGVDAIAVELIARGREALAQGRVADGHRFEQVLVRARPQHPALASYREAVEAAQRAQSLVRKGDIRARAGRIFKPEGKGAVAAYRDALKAFPDFVPARDGLVRLQADRLNRALAAAQAGEYGESERLQAEAARVLPDSPAAQDMAARIVELRQARTEQLLAQGDAAVDALDLELAERRLAEAERVSVQARGLDALSERIELALHYGRFRPGQVFREPLASGGEGPEMVVLAHGSFQMGSPADEAGRQDNEGPRHAVSFERGFAIARAEVTVGEFGWFVEATGYRSLATRRGRSTVYDERGGAMSEHSGVDWRRDHAGRPAPADLPVIHVGFEDAEAYVAWLSAQTGQRYRLPSEAEFEYALRGGQDGAFPWGGGVPARVVGNLTGDGDVSQLKRRWSNAIPGYNDGHWGPAPVRSYPAEAFGTFDLVGNVSEWVLDCWHDSYRRAPTDGSAWVNPGCEERVIRGASWASTLDRARSAYRQPAAVGTTHARLGFRVVREL